MSSDISAGRSSSPLRLWPGVVIVRRSGWRDSVCRLSFRTGRCSRSWAACSGSSRSIVWWVFFSRAAWFDRIAAVVLMIGAMAATYPLLDVSLATGAMGFIFPMLAVPGICLAFVIWAVVSRRVVDRRAARDHGRGDRRGVRGVDARCAPVASRAGSKTTSRGDGRRRLKIACWHWATTRRRRGTRRTGAGARRTRRTCCTRRDAAAPVHPSHPLKARAPDDAMPAPVHRERRRSIGPGFRGPERDGIVRGVHIATDWSASPPKELWRRPIGPGWSSFSVHGDVFYTQEQRGEDEIVAAYRVSTGAPVWKHRDQARFWESNGGPGPRGTPTLHNGRVYSLGATGILNVLDEATGRAIWSRNAGTDSNTKIPDWGFSASPLLIDDMVIVAVAGKLVAYDRDDRQPALDWA